MPFVQSTQICFQCKQKKFIINFLFVLQEFFYGEYNAKPSYK